MVGKLLVGGLAVLVLVLLAVVIVMNGRSKSQSTGSVAGPGASGATLATNPVAMAAPATSATVVSPQEVARQLAVLLQKSSGARSTVVSATQQVGGCQESPAQGVQQLQQAITARNEILSGLPAVALSALPGGVANGQLLAQAIQASVSADTGFIGWMNDIASSGCPVATATDASYQSAASASQQASNAKRAFVAWWNPIASQYGLPTYHEADL